MDDSHFVKPTDIKAFWKAPHCGPGETDPNEVCGFCEATNGECAKSHTEFIRTATEEQLRKYAEDQQGAGNDNMPCGGSGFWCPNPECGRFWAQDSCGDSGWGGERSVDGKELVVIPNVDSSGDFMWADAQVNCVCGQRLFYLLPDDWYEKTHPRDEEDDDVYDDTTGSS